MSNPPAHDSTILFVTAAPRDQPMVSSDVEYRAIDEAIRGRFRLVAKLAAQPEDLVNALAEVKPAILHFSGHGSGKKGLLFQDGDAASVKLSRKALESILDAKELMGPVRLMVLNACWTVEQAKVIAKNGPDTIAMKTDVLDEVAKAFAGSYYRLLCSMSPHGAFDAAIAALDAKRLPETDSPVFVDGTTSMIDPRSAVPNRTALRKFMTEQFPEDQLANVEFDFAAYFQDRGQTLKHMPRGQRVRELISWLEDRRLLPALVEVLRSEASELVAANEKALYQ